MGWSRRLDQLPRQMVPPFLASGRIDPFVFGKFTIPEKSLIRLIDQFVDTPLIDLVK